MKNQIKLRPVFSGALWYQMETNLRDKLQNEAQKYFQLDWLAGEVWYFLYDKKEN